MHPVVRALPLLLIFESGHFPTHSLPSGSVLVRLALSIAPASPSPDAWLTQLCLPGWHSHGQTLKSWTLDCQHRTSTMHSAYRPPTGTSLTAVASIQMTTSSASEGPRLAVHYWPRHAMDHKPPAAGLPAPGAISCLWPVASEPADSSCTVTQGEWVERCLRYPVGDSWFMLGNQV